MVSEEKKKLVQSLAVHVHSSPVVGVVNFENLPAPQLQKMRSQLKAKGVDLVMARQRLLQRILQESSKQNLPQLVQQLKGMPALILANENPFVLYASIQKSTSPAPAKAGQTAPRDIMVRAGPTSFAPGPIISELAAAGIKTKVENGKLSVIADTVVVKEGGVISAKVADTLKRLDIKPMEIGLNVVAVWENGFVFGKKDLAIDEQEYAHHLIQAAQWALNLAVECAYPAGEVTELLLQKAFREAKSVALESIFLTTETMSEFLVRSEQEAAAVKKEANL